jgi:DNA-binding LacI/PurR family transcriptional regulator
LSPPLFGDWTADSGFEIGRALTKDGADSRRAELPFTAVFSSNDQMALGLIHAFRAAGLDVPRDVSIVGFDDIPESAHFWPPLTTVRQDFRSLGVRCVTMLLDAIHRAGDPAAAADTGISPVVEPQLVIRDSVSWVLAALATHRESLTEAPEHAIIMPRCYRSHGRRRSSR